LHNLIISVWCR